MEGEDTREIAAELGKNHNTVQRQNRATCARRGARRARQGPLAKGSLCFATKLGDATP